MTITAEESTEQLYNALIKVLNDAKVPKSNDVIPKVAALMKLMLAFINGDGDLQLHPRSNMPGKVLRLMAEVAQAMPGVLVDFTAATGNGKHRPVTYTCNTVVALLGNGDDSGESDSDEGAAQRSQNPRASKPRKAKAVKGSSGSASDDDDEEPSRKKPRKDKAKAAKKAPEDAQTESLKRQKEEYEKDLADDSELNESLQQAKDALESAEQAVEAARRDCKSALSVFERAHPEPDETEDYAGHKKWTTNKRHAIGKKATKVESCKDAIAAAEKTKTDIERDLEAKKVALEHLNRQLEHLGELLHRLGLELADIDANAVVITVVRKPYATTKFFPFVD